MKVFDRIEEIVAAVCMCIMTVLTFANVVSRYVLSASLSFSEEITTYLFVLLSLLGTSIAVRRRAHLGLTVITDVVDPKIRRALHCIGYLFAIVFTAAIFWYGVQMVGSQMALGQETATMQWPEWIYGSFVPIGALVTTIRFVQVLIEEVKGE